MTSSSSVHALLPRLPSEIRDIIYSYCDPATLAVVCSVSFESLVSASKLLYAVVGLRSRAQIALMFCSLDESNRSEAISLHLSLHRINSLTLDPRPLAWDSIEYDRSASIDRLEGRSLPLDFLSLSSTLDTRIFHSDEVAAVFAAGLGEVGEEEMCLDDFFDPQKAQLCRGAYESRFQEESRLGFPWARLEVLELFDVTVHKLLSDWYSPRLNWVVDRPLHIIFKCSAEAFVAEHLAESLGWGRAFTPALTDAKDISVSVHLQWLPEMKDWLRSEVDWINGPNGRDESWGAVSFKPFL